MFRKDFNNFNIMFISYFESFKLKIEDMKHFHGSHNILKLGPNVWEWNIWEWEVWDWNAGHIG